jgi:hypothetical protein
MDDMRKHVDDLKILNIAHPLCTRERKNESTIVKVGSKWKLNGMCRVSFIHKYSDEDMALIYLEVYF